MNIIMTEDTAQGIYWELNHTLKPQWTLTRQEDGFRIGPPQVMRSIVPVESNSEVWRVAQFVAYDHFSSIAKIAQGIEFISIRESGTGFRIIFDAQSNSLSDDRPVSTIDS